MSSPIRESRDIRSAFMRDAEETTSITPPPHDRPFPRDTLTSSIEERDELTSTPSLAQAMVLADRTSRWLALNLFEKLLDTPLPFSEQERIKLLASTEFFNELQPLLNEHPLPFFRRFVLNAVIVPFCEKIVPIAVRKATEIGISTVLSASKPETPFPGTLVSTKLRDLLGYFSVLHSALQRTAKASMMTGTLHERIGQELEHAQSTYSTTHALYAKVLDKAITFAIECAEEQLLHQLDKRPLYLRLPGQFLVKAAFLTLNITMGPVLWASRSWIITQLEKPYGKDMRNLAGADQLSHPLLTPFIRFTDRMMQRFHSHLKDYNDPSLAPSTGIDQEVFKQCLKQHLLMLNLCSCISQEELRQALEDSHLKRMLNLIQDRFVLDEIATSVSGTLAIFWETITTEGALQKELDQLILALNEGFIQDTVDDMAVADLNSTLDQITEHLIRTQIDGKLNEADKILDKVFSFFTKGPDLKHSITQTASDWLGLKNPVKTEITERLLPIGLSASTKSTEKMVNFWTLPYNLRYGLIHRMLLLPWLR